MAKRTSASQSILTLGLELLAVGLFTVMAGANDEIGTVMIILMFGFWMIFIISESGIVANLGAALGKLINNPSNT